MPDVTTPVLGLSKPGINESKDTWGTKWNVNADKLDTDAGDTDAKIAALQARCAALETEAAKASWVGEIRLHNGTLASIDAIPGGVWKLCDGNNGTPNLTDKFVMGAHSGRVPGSQGGTWSISATVDAQGWHTHGGVTGYHALTWNEMPQHNHEVYDPGHGHGWPGLGGSILVTGGGDGNVQWGGNTTFIDYRGFSLSNSGTGIQIQSAGASWGHPHDIYGDGSHAHNVTGTAVPPYYALAYVMRTA